MTAPPAVSSNFCEYREGHLHAGIDVRTYGREGIECVQIEAGQIGATMQWWAPGTTFFSSPERIQIAGVPARNEPDRGEVNYPYLFDLMDELGYDGWIGCEYRPAGDTLAGLGWARAHGIVAAGP